MSRLVGFGIDFGTTNSLIAAAYDDHVEVVPVVAGESGDMGVCLPSIVYFDHDGLDFVGVEAVRQFENTARRTLTCGSCNGVHACTTYEELQRRKPVGIRTPDYRRCRFSRLAYGLKAVLADGKYESTESWGRHYSLPEMIGWVLRELADNAGVNGASTLPVVIGAPVHFEHEHGTSSHVVALERLRAAAVQAGVGDVMFLGEPEAALRFERYELGSPTAEPVAVAVDFGGGTFDVAVSRAGGDPWAPTVTSGVPLGGERFDGYLFRQYLLEQLGLEGADDSLLRRLSTLRDMAMNAGRDELYDELRRLPGRGRANPQILEILNGGFIYDLWKAIQEAKVELSSSPSTHIDFHKHGIDIRVPVERSVFESLIRDDLDSIRRTVIEAVESAGAKPTDVRVVLRTGGSSSIPAFVEMLKDTFTNAAVSVRPTLTTIVAGLAHHARELAGVASVPLAGHAQAAVPEEGMLSSEAEPIDALYDDAFIATEVPSDLFAPPQQAIDFDESEGERDGERAAEAAPKPRPGPTLTELLRRMTGGR